jgi:NAD(P)H-hydrate epimerase
MVAIEKKADAAGLSYDQMMENAGRSIAHHILSVWPGAADFKILVLVGPGNNGGDGLVAGYHLAQAGAEVSYYLLKERPPNDHNLKRVQELKAQIAAVTENNRYRELTKLIESSDLIIDGLLGTGFKLPLRGNAQKLLRMIKQRIAKLEKNIFVAAIDCPSGVDCDTGEVADDCIAADITVTLAAVKIGLLKAPGAELTGELFVGDIGLDKDDSDLENIALETMDPDRARSWIPARPRHAHKGTFGRVLIVAGSINYPGAAILAAMGAYRSGAGLVTLAVPDPIYQSLVSMLPEATWIITPHDQGAITSSAVEVLGDALDNSQALLVGPGFGLERQSLQFLEQLFAGKEAGERIGFVGSQGENINLHLPPVVLDADALKLVSEIPNWANLIPPRSVLTPHPGEMSVLSGLPVEKIQHDRINVAEHWSQQWGHVVVLKGANTVVASPKGSTTIIPIATSALAKAGTGDVLSGVIASLMAQGMKPYMAAGLGAYLHGRAGMLAAEAYQTTTSVLAGDVADALPEVYSELQAG